MSILILLVPLALILGACFVGFFFWGVQGDQFEDLETPKHRMLLEKDE
jgi:cbb3-type cytochrome oxidase maturation protein